MGPLATGLAFIPLALAAGIGAHAAGHIVTRHGVRGPLTGAFVVTAGQGYYTAGTYPALIAAGAVAF